MLHCYTNISDKHGSLGPRMARLRASSRSASRNSPPSTGKSQLKPQKAWFDTKIDGGDPCVQATRACVKCTTFGTSAGTRGGSCTPSATLLTLRSSSSLLLSSLELSDTRVYAPQIRALLGTASHFYTLRSVTIPSQNVPLSSEYGICKTAKALTFR